MQAPSNKKEKAAHGSPKTRSDIPRDLFALKGPQRFFNRVLLAGQENRAAAWLRKQAG
jgi:hypothetical protein